MSTYDRVKLAEELKRDEGYRDRPYLDSRGILTIGIGHALGHKPLPTEAASVVTEPGYMDKPWPESVLQALFGIDLKEHVEELERLCKAKGVVLNDFTDARQRALINMCFNLGSARLSGFRNMWKAIGDNDWRRAADEALDSRWARQVGPRADRIAAMLREG